MRIEKLHNEPTRCPTCKHGKISYFRVTGRHVNGEQFEEVGYSCGLALKWVPNLQRREQTGHCRHSAEARDKREKAKTFEAKVKQLLQKSGVSEEYEEAFLARNGWCL
jgi:hypothetical protein